MRVLLVGHRHPSTLVLANDLARFKVRVMRAESRDAVYESLSVAEAVLLGFPPGDRERNDLTLCRAIRARSNIPILALVGGQDVGERILGSRAGADEYVCRPYSAGTLIARIETLHRLRDRQLEPSGVLCVDDVVVDLHSRSVTVAGNVIALAKKEFQILALLAEEGGAVCVRETLCGRLWGISGLKVEHTLNVHIATLRRKIGRPGLIETVRGVGYRLAVALDTASPC